MGRQFRHILCILAGPLTLVVALSAQNQSPSFPTEVSQIRFNSGQSVVPYFEGWIRNADGTFDLVFGYFNRNWKQELVVPVGADNKVEPSSSDGGQPTYFLARRQRFLYRVRVPADFGKKEVTWTITSNGRTEKGYGTLQPEQEITERVIMTNGNFNPGTDDPNKPPTLSVAPLTAPAVGIPVTITATAADDGLPKPRAAAPRPPPTVTTGGFGAQVNSSGGGRQTGLRVGWLQYSGPAKVTFEQKGLAPVTDGQVTTAAEFAAPGVYKLIASATDGIMTTRVDVMVTVPAGQRPSAQP
jgi:hypothetical protein